jgi:hypothetical protein
MKTNFLFWLMGLLLWACTAPPTLVPTPLPPTVMSTPSGTLTPTTVWFPPTATYTPFPTPIVTPTEDMLPEIGRVLHEDNFSSQGVWSLSDTQEGSVALGNNELTIAIGETDAYLFSVRENPTFNDFYMEITAQPNLCRELDEYGVLFRVTSTGNHYRFSLSCNGQVRLDRISGGEISSPQPWLLSGSVPPGAPSSSRIGIMAQGEEMRFFVNGRYQFSITDPLLTSGGVGVFARSVNERAVTVNFSDLVIYEIGD